MKELKNHPRYQAFKQRAARFLCMLNFNHALLATEFDHKGSDYRVVDRCNCGKLKRHGEWTDDNHAQGYGTFH